MKLMGRKIVLLLITWLAAGACCLAQTTTLRGIVTDSVSGEGLPFATVVYKGTATGVQTDSEGRFSLTTPAAATDTIEVTYVGYDPRQLVIARGKVNNLHIALTESNTLLREVVVKPKKEKYSKKDNPAVAFVRKVIALRESNDPRHRDYFSYDQYEKLLIARNDYRPKPRKEGKTGKFDFLSEFVDTLDAGTTILPIIEKERKEKVYYRRSPQTERRVVEGTQSSGLDEILSRDGVDKFLNETLQEVDIFQNNIPLFLQRFVSPLSTFAPNFYKYYLLDTLDVNGYPCADLGFVPFNSESFGFTGHLYVRLDSTYFVQRVILNVPHDINLNFISRMNIEQTYERLPDGTRLITKDDINLNFKLTEKAKGLYAQRLIVYSNHSFDKPEGRLARVFDESAPVVTPKDAYDRPEEYWAAIRPPEAAKKNPNSVSKLMTRLRAVPAFAITEKVFGAILSGYVPTNKDARKNKFDFGPVNSVINGNAIEGARFRLGGATTPVFNRHFFVEGYAAYGTKDRKMKYDALLEYSFNERKDYLREFPRHSLRFEYMYDINKLGQEYMYTSKDNIMLAIKRKKDTRATYLRRAELTYLREHYSGLSYSAAVRNYREYATPYAPFLRQEPDGSQTPVRKYDMTELELKLRYAHNEKFYQSHDQRIPITFDAFIFNVSHVMAKKGVLGSSFTYQRTDVGLQKRFWFSAFGYLDVIAKAGKVWNKVPYPLLILPNANLTYTIQPEAYTNMNVLEFINDEYASWDVTYYMNGQLLNRLPLIKKLQWREVFCFRGLWGHLSDKNNPAKNGAGLYAFPEGSGTLGRAPYMEASVGIENIFKFLRIDYVWRLNYRDRPNIQTRGVRCTMRVSF